MLLSQVNFILNRAISSGGTNILHLCHEGATNDISYYTGYPADVTLGC